ncbi:hypothetical protein ASPBRDRAFT_673258 [Aspergillus brasiliensis CBS 101740]|uniref:Uncharacterized protein n=1 Tax=Aspergillus brasiliensis (strain CBS 101740 / IMI 381727 / IBT 21946) TaxID=767769 RepID=A0A1L9UMH1_ASPBC|nr:hypothetical protein ASPBRDRAFT_673258 [Aspergillus brasiliensis CBS 101740]
MAWLPTYAMQVACGLLGGYEIRFPWIRGGVPGSRPAVEPAVSVRYMRQKRDLGTGARGWRFSVLPEGGGGIAALLIQNPCWADLLLLRC